MHRRHSLVTVVGMMVAVMVLAGGAMAASHFIITNINQIKPSVRAQLRGNRGPRGFAGAQGLQGPQGVQGPQGTAGTPGPPGTALAYAHVSAAWAVDHVKAIAPGNVTHPQSGIYCITGLPFTPNNVVATLGTGGSAVDNAVELGAITPGCPAATQVSVQTYTIMVDTTTGAVSGFVDVDNDFNITIN
jgi:Collagen triple helix repeat (20 copies)